MPITRTAIVDDDGTGKTGTVIDNAWKQQLYDQIDAFGLSTGAAVGNTIVPWTPIDASGAGLALGNAGCAYVKIGRVVLLAANISYPATSNGASAYIGGLPFANQGNYTGGVFTTYGVANTFFITYADNRIRVMNPATGLDRTNANLSGLIIVFNGFYFT